MRRDGGRAAAPVRAPAAPEFPRGTIKLVKVHNFMTYSGTVVAKPGPRLNLVLGPNGGRSWGPGRREAGLARQHIAGALHAAGGPIPTNARCHPCRHRQVIAGVRAVHRPRRPAPGALMAAAVMQRSRACQEGVAARLARDAAPLSLMHGASC